MKSPRNRSQKCRGDRRRTPGGPENAAATAEAPPSGPENAAATVEVPLSGPENAAATVEARSQTDVRLRMSTLSMER
jgi:hypothetical protein